MLAVAARKDQGYLSMSDIRQFPGADLQLIDFLWVTYSEGKFGFSVQKQIWLEVGGKLDFGKNHKAAFAAYEKMSDRNGWRQNGDYISFSQATFDTSAPKGHLPSAALPVDFGGVWGGSVVGGLRVLFSRIQTCKV
jgi:hypothetical protein